MKKEGKRVNSRLDFEMDGKILAKSKRSQVTIFIIIAVVIVALVVLIFMIYPKIKNTTISEENPYSFMQSCMQDKLKESVESVSSQGGSVSPEKYFLYNNSKIDYLCYTNEYYKPCVVQQPFVSSHIEDEINNNIKDYMNTCLNNLQTNFQKKGYTVSLKKGSSSVELLPKRVVARTNSTLTLTKGNSQNYNEFNIILNNNLYELASIASSIVKWETNYGDAETTLYMTYYKDLKVEKYKQSEGTKVYILTDRNTGNKFQFATRSVAWPSGYGTGETV
ncbi:MAG: hypothetical protein AABW51_00245 [Nanoarchaeota archaeon]